MTYRIDSWGVLREFLVSSVRNCPSDDLGRGVLGHELYENIKILLMTILVWIGLKNFHINFITD